MNLPNPSNHSSREHTTIPHLDISLARQEAARIAQSQSNSRPESYDAAATRSYQSYPHQHGFPNTPANLMSVPVLPSASTSRPQVGVSSLTQHAPPIGPIGDSTALVPYVAPDIAAISAPIANAPTAKKNPFSNFSIDNIKGMFDRMGGVDGIVSTMGQAQKVMQSVSQFAPMAKLLMGSFLKKKDGDEDVSEDKPRRRRKRKHKRRGNQSPNNNRRRKSRRNSPLTQPKRSTKRYYG